MSYGFSGVFDLIVLPSMQNMRTQKRAGGTITMQQSELLLGFTQSIKDLWAKTYIVQK
jgi:hypothetical protein